MGAFCTRTICNVEKGDENYQKLLDRKINTDAKQDIPENDEKPMQSPTTDTIQKYTRSARTASDGETGITTKKKKDNKAHVSVPTPSIEEIQTAMDNMAAMFTPDQPAVDNEEYSSENKPAQIERKETPKLPTMAFDVSNLRLANPFAADLPESAELKSEEDKEPGEPEGYQQTNTEIKDSQTHNKFDDLPNALAPIPSDKTTDSKNIAPVSQAQDIKPGASADVADIFGVKGKDDNIQQNATGTVVIHGDDKENAAQKLISQVVNADDNTKGVNMENVEININKKEEEDGNLVADNVENREDRKSTTKKIGVVKNEDRESMAQQIGQLIGDQQSERTEDATLTEPTNKMDDAWKSDYETPSEYESGNDVDSKDKRRGSKKLELNEVPSNPQKVLQLDPNDTTLDAESSEDESNDVLSPMVHKNLYREHSRYRWKKKEMAKHEDMIKAEIEKLKVQQEMDEMTKMMSFYRQQSQQQ